MAADIGRECLYMARTMMRRGKPQLQTTWRMRPFQAQSRQFSSSQCRWREKHAHKQASDEERELYMSILQASSTKREAKAYLQRYKPTAIESTPEDRSSRENKASFASATSIPEIHVPGHISKARNRSFIRSLVQQTRPATFERFANECFAPEILEEQLHIALVKIRAVETLSDEILEGIGRTLKQLHKLGLHAVVVLEDDKAQGAASILHSERADGFREQADRVVGGIEGAKGRARRIDGSISTTGWEKFHTPREIVVSLPTLIFAPLSRGVIPVIPPIAYDSMGKTWVVRADRIMLSLTKMLSENYISAEEICTNSQAQQGSNVVSLDRIIILDPLGGIPAYDRPQGAHVFINLEQEYSGLQADLQKQKYDTSKIQNTLEVLRDCLSLLPSTSSAIVTTPELASSTLTTGGVRNPLIYNLITDKPVFSSSLPVTATSPHTQTTLLKHGVLLLMLPPSSFTNGVTLSNHPSIDMKRLVELIEDSFGKRLDVEHYLRRVDANMAAVIIAGNYDGGAIITWEEGFNGRRVPYLDKFAVARRSQGAGGVADVVFKAMILGEGMFAQELLWRSRKDNPVNKWYFERSKGTYKLSKDRWTMFWTTDGVAQDDEKFREYLKICENVVPSLQE